MAEFGSATHTLLSNDEKEYWQTEQQHPILPLLITHTHNHKECFALTKIPPPYVNVWIAQLAQGTVFATDYYRCAVIKHHIFVSCLSHKWQICMHYSGKCRGWGAGTDYSTLLAQWYTSCSITLRSYSYALYLLDDVFRQFYLLFMGKKGQ